MTQFTEEQLEEAFDMYGLDSDMSLEQYKEIVDHMGDLIDPNDYSWYNLNYYHGMSGEEKLANYWLDDFPIKTGYDHLDTVIENNLDLAGIGKELSMNGIFVEDGYNCGYFES